MDRDVVLPDRLLRRMVDVVEEARRDHTAEVLPHSVLIGLNRLVPGIGCDFGKVDWPARRVLSTHTFSEGRYELEDDSGDPLAMETWWRLMGQNPSCSYLRRTGRLEVVQLSDFVTIRQLHDMEIYQDERRTRSWSPPRHDRPEHASTRAALP